MFYYSTKGYLFFTSILQIPEYSSGNHDRHNPQIPGEEGKTLGSPA
jgi:hypothetical protein